MKRLIIKDLLALKSVTKRGSSFCIWDCWPLWSISSRKTRGWASLASWC